jgi:hypothetical protein
LSNLTCLHCGAPSTNGVVLCARCQHTAGRALVNLAVYHEDLFNLPVQAFGVRRSTGISDPTGTTVATIPAANSIEDSAAATRTMLVAWVRILIDDRPGLRWPADNVEAMAKLLGQQLRSIATLEWAGRFVTEVTEHERRLRRIVEANKGRWYAGVCGTVLDSETGAFCTRVLYADPEAADVRCPVCRTSWPVDERRKILLDLARDQVTSVATIARAVGILFDGETSQAKLERRIQNWIDRGLIERRGHLDIDGRVRKVYRVGDVLDMLTDAKTDRPA